MRKVLNRYVASIFLVMAAFFSFAAATLADSFSIQITNSQTNVGEASVKLYGNHGFNRIPGTFTDSTGRFTFDRSHISNAGETASTPNLVFVKDGFRFEPPELTVSLATCPGYVCSVSAISGPKTTVALEWTVQETPTTKVAGVPVTVSGAYISCPKLTDEDGYVVFAVEKRLTTCNNSDQTSVNDFYTVVVGQPTTLQTPTQCTYTPPGADGFKVCPSANLSRTATAACLSAAPPALGSSTTYKIDVKDVNNVGVPGIEFFGDSNITTLSAGYRSTNQQGRWQFSTTQLNNTPNPTIAADAEITIIPYAQGYRFEPSQLKVRPGSCPSNTCRITAWKDSVYQTVVRITSTASGTPLVGTQVQVTSPNVCEPTKTVYTDKGGIAYAATLSQAQCDNLNQSTVDDWTSVTATYPGCTFTHQSDRPFTVCPETRESTVALTAFCGGSVPPRQLFVRGFVFDADGNPVASASIKNSGIQTAVTDANGGYSFSSNERSRMVLSASKIGMLFDPESSEIVELKENIDGFNFQAVIPVSQKSPFDEVVCNATLAPVITGRVVDENGFPMNGVEIYNYNALDDTEEHVATTGSDGKYSFSKSAMTDIGVHPERHAEYGFSPSSYYFPDNRCDRSEVNFMKVNEPVVVLAGYVQARIGGGNSSLTGLKGASVTIEYDGKVITTLTNVAGYYAFEIPQSVEYSISASYGTLTVLPVNGSNPTRYEGESLSDELDKNFLATEELTPSPTPTVTATPTATPTFTPTPTPTRTGTPAPTPTITRTPTKTATPTVTPTGTRTTVPTVTQTPANTLTPQPPTVTPTQTSSPTATKTGTVTSTPRPVATNTFSPTLSPTFTATARSTVTAAPTQPPLATQTAMPTSTAVPTKVATVNPDLPNIPDSHLDMVHKCSPNPEQYKVWLVRNKGNTLKKFALVALYSEETIIEDLAPDTEVFRSLNTVAGTDDTAAVFELQPTSVPNSYTWLQVRVQKALKTRCSKSDDPSDPSEPSDPNDPSNPGGPSTPTPGPTSQPDGTPTRVGEPTLPPGQPGGTPSPRPTTQPDAPVVTPTVIPTNSTDPNPPFVTPIPTEIPDEDLYAISGSFRGTRGTFSSTQRKQLQNVTFNIAARNVQTGELYGASFEGAQKFRILVPDGKYLVSFVAQGLRITAASRPVRYSLIMNQKQQNITWDINIRANTTTKKSRSLREKTTAFKRSLKWPASTGEGE